MHPRNELDDWFVATILPHEASLLRYLSRLSRNQADVADICQEAYVRIYQAAGRQRPESPKSFLFTTARNLMADRARRERVVSVDYTEDPGILDLLMNDISPERQCAADEDLRRLAAAYNRLSDNFREVIWLMRVDGLTQREAAKRLKVNEGTLESRLSRALNALAHALAKDYTAEGAHPVSRLDGIAKSPDSPTTSVQGVVGGGNVSLGPNLSMQAAAAHAP